MLAGGVAARPLEASQEAGWPESPPVKIFVVYLGTGGAWPKPDFDAPATIAREDRKIAKDALPRFSLCR